MKKYIATLILLLQISFTIARADIAPNPIFGGLSITTPATNESAIALVSESVVLTVNTNNTVDTCAEFFLKNLGSTTNLTVGFPHFYTTDFLSFSASVSGTPVVCRTDKVTHNFGRKTQTTFWELWDMQIDSQEVVHVVVNYTSKLWLTREIITMSHFSSWYKGKEEEDILKKTRIGKLEYILTTGAHWNGSIGKATIRVDLSALSFPTIKDTSPQDAMIREHEVIWEMDNFEPQSNIRLSFFLSGPFNKLKLLQSLHNQHPDDWHIADELADEFLNERLRLYEKCVMSAEIPTYTLSLDLRGLSTEEQDKKTGQYVYSKTILRMAIALVQAYEKDYNHKSLRRVVPKILPMLHEFKRSLEKEEGSWRDSWLEDISNATPICERVVRDMKEE